MYISTSNMTNDRIPARVDQSEPLLRANQIPNTHTQTHISKPHTRSHRTGEEMRRGRDGGGGMSSPCPLALVPISQTTFQRSGRRAPERHCGAAPQDNDGQIQWAAEVAGENYCS